MPKVKRDTFSKLRQQLGAKLSQLEEMLRPAFEAEPVFPGSLQVSRHCTAGVNGATYTSPDGSRSASRTDSPIAASTRRRRPSGDRGRKPTGVFVRQVGPSPSGSVRWRCSWMPWNVLGARRKVSERKIGSVRCAE
jgi:hypothetical protein